MIKERMSVNSFIISNDAHFVNLKAFSNTINGRVYLRACGSIAQLLKSAKENKILAQVKSEILTQCEICPATMLFMVWVDDFWCTRSNEEKEVFYKVFKRNKNKLQLISRLIYHKKTGKKNIGRFQNIIINVSSKNIYINLNSPDERFVLEEYTAKKFFNRIFFKIC